ncbi:hypothetical protein G6011_07090 [Alternaria panax]|uniref:Uncharacterized protein n=1 Tax=Alternaria panax TaxID=48097 RepID=A0AAD4I7M9_9PLEO|nr:hypothetical protein G6011_07090 [Alternaria panax]
MQASHERSETDEAPFACAAAQTPLIPDFRSLGQPVLRRIDRLMSEDMTELGARPLQLRALKPKGWKPDCVITDNLVKRRRVDIALQ